MFVASACEAPDSEEGVEHQDEADQRDKVIPGQLPDPDQTPPVATKPVKVYILSGQSNMVGMGEVGPLGTPGTLATVVKTDKRFQHLVDNSGYWTVRNDVWYRGVVTAGANKWLTIGCGSGSSTIGPELGFGHIMGYYHDEPVLIIKASQGNRSLGWDILPPGSQRYTVDGRTYAGYKDGDDSWSATDPNDPYTDIKTWYAGKQYDDFVTEIHKVLDNFSTNFPQWKNQGYEIAGFAWFQGHKDSGNAVHASRYEINLVNFIKAIRAEFKVPKAPFVISTIGFDGWKMSGNYLTVANAQLAVSGDKGKYSEFSGNVLTMETRDFWRDASISPKEQGYHYNRNAETYMLVGEALGRGMVKLLGSTSTDSCPNDPNKTSPGQCGCGVPEGSCSSTSTCVEAAENKTASLSCPSGQKIASINFASYGLPTGSCPGGFAKGSCHASTSLDKVKAACLNKPSCSVLAGNSVFGDPCVGKFKKLGVTFSCSGGTDGCPNDPNKTEPGICGCGVPEGTCQQGVSFQESFESPNVTGKSKTKPDGWVAACHPDYVGIFDEDSGGFTTPFGSQALSVYTTTGCTTTVTTSASKLSAVLAANTTYTLTFNVAKLKDAGTTGYIVEFLAIKDATQAVTVLASTSGKSVSTFDMSHSGSLVFKTGASHSNLGQRIAIRLKKEPSVDWRTSPLFDNIKLTASVGSPNN
jgi:alpha-galactosidase